MVLIADHVALLANHLLACLSLQDLEPFRTRVLRIPLVSKQVLADYGQRDDYAFFIEHGVVSLMSEPLHGEEGIQVAMIGREGMVGSYLPSNAEFAAQVRLVVHVPGTAFRVNGSDLRQAAEQSRPLHDACVRFTQSLTTQIMQTATFNARRSLMERCARWLVMIRDRIDTDEIRITHEGLASMLGMRRSGVTIAASALQQAKLIRNGRGRFIITDIGRLRAVAEGDSSMLATARGRGACDDGPPLKAGLKLVM